ncbi:preprotein translocase subunit SecE [Nesterenkonia sp. MY13]|uniref:Protein translocase subunit SecE n=1 Tax=Nesterenkonia sedimenti TaxID=1463632 RepID=A0A7X8YDD1_9MICC|nr:preprotein translocase subunit SecE [Nesterenkonia sedimenti]NLS09022.1 preprotein translocase subunit SecE [Nesterenkonia sedimenti]
MTDADGSSGGGSRPKNPFARIWLFLKQVFDELRKVIVPTRRELLNYTLVVLFFVLIVIGIVSGLDWIFSNAADLIFGGGAGPE